MPKSIFKIDFDRSLPRYFDEDGVDQIASVGRLEEPDGENKNKVQIEASEAVITALKADPDYEFVEDVVEESKK